MLTLKLAFEYFSLNMNRETRITTQFRETANLNMRNKTKLSETISNEKDTM